jgi:hypothetical protein
MGDARYPLIRGNRFKTDFYRSPKGGGGSDVRLPPRDPKQHRDTLIRQLDAVLGQSQQRSPGQRDPEATRELVTVLPKPGFDLEPSPLGSEKADVRVLGVTEAGATILDAREATLEPLRRKIDAFADDSKVTDKGARKNAPAVAPIEVIRNRSGVGLRQAA